MSKLVVEVLERRHDRNRFDCGNEELNAYLKKLARQHQEKDFARTWVAVEGSGTQVFGYITLAMGHVAFENADPAVFRGLPRHPMPMLHVARLATDLQFQGRGIASLLIAHAVDVAIEASRSMGVYGLELVAIDEGAYRYYLRRGFLPVAPDTRQLYVPLTTLKAAKSR